MIFRKNAAEVKTKGTEQNLLHILFAGKETCHLQWLLFHSTSPFIRFPYLYARGKHILLSVRQRSQSFIPRRYAHYDKIHIVSDADTSIFTFFAKAEQTAAGKLLHRHRYLPPCLWRGVPCCDVWLTQVSSFPVCNRRPRSCHGPAAMQVFLAPL